MSEQEGRRELSRLESLPGEILNSIYRYAVVEEQMVEAATCIFEEKGKWRSNEPALARTCAQFRREVLPLYYAENIFKFPSTRIDQGPHLSCGRSKISSRVNHLHVCAWLRSIGPAHLHHIQRVGATVSIMKIQRDRRLSTTYCNVVASISQQAKNVDFKVGAEAEGKLDHCCARLASHAKDDDDLGEFERVMWAMVKSYDDFNESIC